MKNKLVLSALCLAIASASVSVNASEPAEKSSLAIGYKLSSYEMSGYEGDVNVLTIAYERKLNSYFSIGIWGGVGTKDEAFASHTDTFIESALDTIVMTTVYESKASIDSEYGVEIIGAYPLSNNFSIYGKLGYQQSNWSTQLYTPFVDNLPSSDPAQSFSDGAGECEITGIESFCGNNLSSIEYDGDISGVSIESGLRWDVSNKTAISIGYRNLTSGGDKLASVSFQLLFKF